MGTETVDSGEGWGEYIVSRVKHVERRSEC